MSVFDSIPSALAHHGRSRRLGTFLAEIVVPDGTGLAAERTTAREGHWTIWGDADEILVCLVGIVEMKSLGR